MLSGGLNMFIAKRRIVHVCTWGNSEHRKEGQFIAAEDEIQSTISTRVIL
jgi:hypothetical protein